MKYYTIPPPPALAGYIRAFWVLESKVPQNQPYIHRTMADGCAELVFHYRGVFDELLPSGKIEKSFTSGIGGQTQHFNRYLIKENFGIFGVYLYPFAIPQLFNIPAHAISNQNPDLHSVLGRQGKELEEKIMLAPDNESRVNILTALFQERLGKQPVKQPHVFSSISHIIKTRGTVQIDTLAKQYFLSTRQFERSFKHFAGFSPKLFSRIIRFQAAISQYGNKHKTLTALAYDCGYYDQSHFIHDFRKFSGYHPSTYFSGIAEGTSWKEG